MTNEEKELLLKDLCARLPYGVKFKTKYKNHKDITYELLVINKSCETVETDRAIWWNLEDIKPYLRPMSSMTLDEKLHIVDMESEKYSRSEYYTVYFDYLNSIHIDYRGLISMGLALEAPEGMYS